MNKKLKMRCRSKSRCVVCDSPGKDLYKDLTDRLFGAVGSWNIKTCQNKACGTMWLDPSPIEEDLYIAYQDYYTHQNKPEESKSVFNRLVSGYRAFRYGFLPNSVGVGYKVFGYLLGASKFFREHMDYPFVYFKKSKKGRLLELGVGSGDTLKRFSQWGWESQGLDLDPKAVENAVSKGLNVSHGDIFSQQFPNDLFDGIFSSHVVEHVADPQALLNESARILKPGAVFVAVTPNKKSVLHWWFKSSWRELDPPRHLHIFTPASLKALAERAGFSRIEIKSSNYSAAGVFYVSHEISKYGKTQVGNTSLFRYVAQLVRFFLCIIIRLLPLSGEELILIAQK